MPQQPSYRPIPQGIGKETVIPVVIADNSPAVQYPQYHPNPHHHHRRPHYGGKPKQQPVQIIVIEESAPSQGDIS